MLFLSFCVSSTLSYSRTQISALPFWLVTLCFYFSAWLPGPCSDPLGPWESGKGGGADGHSNTVRLHENSLLGPHLSQMHGDDCILSQLKRKVDEDPTGFPCRTHTPLSSQTFNIFPACLCLFSLVSLDGCCGSSELWFPQSREVKRRMQPGWFPWGLETLSPSLIVSDVSPDTSWVSTSPLLLGGDRMFASLNV